MSDPVADLGRKIAAATAAYTFTDEVASAAKNESPEEQEAHRQMDALFDLQSAYEDEAISQPARSLAGIMVQVAIIAGHFREREPCKNLGANQNQQIERRCELAFESIIRVLERESGIDRKALGVDYHAETLTLVAAKLESELDRWGGNAAA